MWSLGACINAVTNFIAAYLSLNNVRICVAEIEEL